jgi:hypothetical protein
VEGLASRIPNVLRGQVFVIGCPWNEPICERLFNKKYNKTLNKEILQNIFG